MQKVHQKYLFEILKPLDDRPKEQVRKLEQFYFLIKSNLFNLHNAMNNIVH